jgi:hypothetical protein
MDIVLSNASNDCGEDYLIKKAHEYGVQEIELKVGYEEILKLEGFKGDYELNMFKSKLSIAGIKLYGLCLYTDFNMVQDIMLAKKCINILNKLGGKNLRLVMKPMPESFMMESTYLGIAGFLNALSRFASNSAGGGNGETTVKIAYDVLSQQSFEFKDIVKLNSMLSFRNAGLCLNLQNSYKNGIYKSAVTETNGFEFTINQISINADSDTFETEAFLSEAVKAYDGPVIVGLSAQNNEFNGKLVRVIKKYKFDNAIIDYTKILYPSSVARIFKRYGDAKLAPTDNIIAGTIGTWRYVYTIGQLGISNGGGFQLAFHHSTDWEEFQLDKPENRGYVSIQTKGSAKISKKLNRMDACLYICLTVNEGMLIEGDEIIITVGDKSGGSEGSRAQTFQQTAFKFFALVDTTGNGIYFEHPNPPEVRIIGGNDKKICIVAPSVVNECETFYVSARVEDCYHNVASSYNSKLILKLDGKPVESAEYEMLDTNPAIVRFNNIMLEKSGKYVFEVCDENGLTGTSNYINCSANKDEYKVYWGDIHCHLGYMDSVGDVNEFYNYAKNVSFLNFTCHSEHMDSFSENRQASNNIQWEIIKQGAREHNEPGRFVTLLGYEDSECGDTNVYFPCDDAPWHADVFVTQLFEFAKKYEAMVIPHMTTYPQLSRGYDWSRYDSDVTPVMEIYSCHGTSEYFGGERPLGNCEPGGYAIDALNHGYKLGFIGSSDGHDCMPGNSPWHIYMNGLIAVYTKELTREAIFDAIKSRRCYATTNARILGYFNIDGLMSGSEFDCETNESINISASFYGTSDIEAADLVRNGEIIHTVKGDGSILEFKLSDIPEKQGHNYYYIRMKQKDGEMAWLSPIFVNRK